MKAKLGNFFLCTLSLTWLSLTVGCQTVAPVPNTLSCTEKKAGWTLLWDGKSDAGWRSRSSESFPAKGWVMEDGVLTVLPRKEGGGGGDIITRAMFSDFELKLEFRLTEVANSGIKYLYVPELHKGTTMEYQLLCPKHNDAKQGKDGNRKVAALYDILPAPAAEMKPIGEWNCARVVVRGMKVEHWLNGKKVLEFERGSPSFKQAVAESKFGQYPNWGEQCEGHILLQDHSDRVSFRNIKIRDLSR